MTPIGLLHSFSGLKLFGKVLISYLSRYGLNCSTVIYLLWWLWHRITHQGWYAIKKQRNQRNIYIYIYIYIYINGLIGRVDRVIPNGPGDLGLIPRRVTPNTLKMVLDTSLLNTQHYKVRIKGKVERSRERSNALPYTSVL